MISGHAYKASGTSNNCTPSSCGPITGTDIADQLQAAESRWKAFMGAMPSDCATGDANGSGGTPSAITRSFTLRREGWSQQAGPTGRPAPAAQYTIKICRNVNAESCRLMCKQRGPRENR